MRFLAPALLAGALLAGALLAAQSQAATIYWAYGDSITRGEGLGFVLDNVPGNDCYVPPYPPYPVSKCAYHWRLRDALDAEGITNNVLNRGEAGESTGMGKSRIDEPNQPLETSRCADPEAGDVLLLMEGTNDISPPVVSTTTIKANLEKMIDDATAACVHSAVASVIRRLKGTAPVGSRDGFPLHPETEDLAIKIDELATETNRAYVDIWTPLCPTQPCFTAHYWGKFNEADPGHVDPSGYDIMADQFETAILADPLPGAATLTSPTGAGTDNTPPFTWNEHVHSDWYFLQVDGGTSYGRWHPEEDICTGGVCSFDPGVVLSQGDHTWRVRTRNLRGVSDTWSATTAFEVWSIAPGATTAVAPDNYEYFSSPPYQPTYRWNPAANPKEYDLEVDDGVGLVVQETVSAAAVCAGGACSATPATALAAGTYTWRVQATNPSFPDGGFSPWLPFEVSCPATMTNDLPAANESGTLVVEACGEIIAGKLGPYTIEASGDVTFHAGNKITIHNGFTVETGADFTAIVD